MARLMMKDAATGKITFGVAKVMPPAYHDSKEWPMPALGGLTIRGAGRIEPGAFKRLASAIIDIDAQSCVEGRKKYVRTGIERE